MKYALLVYGTPGTHDLPEDEMATVLSDYEPLREEPEYMARAQPPEMATWPAAPR